MTWIITIKCQKYNSFVLNIHLVLCFSNKNSKLCYSFNEPKCDGINVSNKPIYFCCNNNNNNFVINWLKYEMVINKIYLNVIKIKQKGVTILQWKKFYFTPKWYIISNMVYNSVMLIWYYFLIQKGHYVVGCIVLYTLFLHYITEERYHFKNKILEKQLSFCFQSRFIAL